MATFLAMGGGAIFVLISFVDVAFQMWNVADVGFQTERSKNALYWQGLHTPALKLKLCPKMAIFEVKSAFESMPEW